VETKGATLAAERIFTIFHLPFSIFHLLVQAAALRTTKMLVLHFAPTGARSRRVCCYKHLAPPERRDASSSRGSDSSMANEKWQMVNGKFSLPAPSPGQQHRQLLIDLRPHGKAGHFP
jgi:hypothetical protein